jgi:hypothetical protein
MSLNQLAAEIHSNARVKGFWGEFGERNVGESLMLIVTEAAEAMESWRDLPRDASLNEAGVTYHSTPETPSGIEFRVEGGEVHFKRTDMHFNQSWEPMTPELFERWKFVAKPTGFPSELADLIIRVLDLAASERIDIDTAVRLKVAYNATREILHGRAR